MAKTIITFESQPRIYQEHKVAYFRVTIPCALAAQYKIDHQRIYKFTIELDE
jgi:hypothetical protein